MFTSVGLTLLCIALIPLYILALSIFGVFSFLGLATGLLPLMNCCFLRRDRKKLAGLLKPSAGAVIEMVAIVEPEAEQQGHDNGGAKNDDSDKPSPPPRRRLAVHWSPGAPDSSTQQRRPPVVIANGLGATLLTIAKLHDLLEEAGFPVLSYDRAGVGMSDPLPPGAKADDVERAVADMRFLMDWCEEGLEPTAQQQQQQQQRQHRPWIVCGLSMGAVVAQCFIARHPEMVGGVVNLDGLPFPFGSKRAKFEAAGQIYGFLTCVSQVGLLRPPLALFGGNSALLRQAATPPRFPLAVLLAQMQCPGFFGAIAQEMGLMMALCDAAAAAWGPAFDLVHLTPAELRALGNAAPARCGDVDESGAWTELPRAPVEAGEDWAPAGETQAVVARLLARAAHQQQQQQQQRSSTPPPPPGNPDEDGDGDVEQGRDTAAGAGSGVVTAPLWLVWQRLAVRVLSARNYEFGVASSWYDAEMQALGGAEHSLQALLAGAQGRRLVFPRRSHAKMYSKSVVPLVCAQVEEVAAVMAGVE